MSETKEETKAEISMKDAYKRFGSLMNEMIKACNEGDKGRVVHMSESMMEHCDDVVAVMYQTANITEQDLVKLSSTDQVDQNLIRLASRPEDEGYLKRVSEVDSRRG